MEQSAIIVGFLDYVGSSPSTLQIYGLSQVTLRESLQHYSMYAGRFPNRKSLA